MKKKILFVFHDSNPLSGATASMLEIVTGISNKSEYEITLLIPDAKGGLHERLNKLGINYIEEKIYNVRYEISNFNALNIVKSYIKVALNYWLALKLKLKGVNYSLVYTNTSDVYTGIYLAKLLKVPHIWHIREFGLEDQNRQHFQGEKKFYKLVSHSAKVISISNALKSKLLSFGVPNEKIAMVYNDVANLTGDFPKAYNTDKQLSLLLVGSITPEKGHPFVIDAIKSMGSSIRLDIVGDDTTPYASVLKKEVKRIGCEGCINFLGYRADVNNLRKKYDVAIVSSTSEAFGRVTVEAMHAKMTVIASKNGANPELIQHGSNGFLYELGNTKEFCDILLKVDSSRFLLQRIGDEASTFSRQFSTSAAEKAVNNIINDTLS